jgi:uncharacterized protein (TIGR02145 family)
MKRLLLMLFCALPFFTFSQIPSKFNFQAIARNHEGNVIANQLANLRISIIPGEVEGIPEFVEIQTATTNSFGLLALEIGSGTNIKGYIDSIDWSDNSWFLKIEMDATGGTDYQHLGTTQILSVPYAIYAKYAENVNDADADPKNELISNIILDGTTLHIVDAKDNALDLSPLLGTDDQNLIITGDVLSIEGGLGSIDLSQYREDHDTDTTNELQTLVLDGDSLRISNGNAIHLLGVIDLDPDPTNEIQDLKQVGNIVTLTLKESPTQINLNPYLDNTDEQELSISNDTIFLDNGGFVKLPAEADPIFAESVASGITGADTARWDAKSDFDGDYNSLTNKPDLSVFLTEDVDSISEFITDAGNKTISNVANPVNDKDAATKAYVDSLFQIVKVIQQGLTDIDGNHYKVVKIGNQYWMAENLKTTTYADGTPLVDGTDSTDISGDDSTKYWFVYDDTSMYKETYGLLYTWAAVMNDSASSDANPSGVQGVCPMGWHVPSDAEWKELEMFLGMSQAEADNEGLRGTNEGGKMKETGFIHWNSPNTGATNESGFTVLPGGIRNYSSIFESIRNSSNFWSSKEEASNTATARNLNYNSSQIIRGYNNKALGYSIRCVKD